MNDLLQHAVAAHQAADLGKAEDLYRLVLAEHPDQLDAMALLGLVIGTQGRHVEAIKLTGEAARRDPKSALFQFHHGSVLMNAKHFPAAIEAYRRAIILQPGFAPAHYNLANTLRAEGLWEEAIEAYRQAVRLNPHYPDAYNNLALSLAHLNRADEALKVAKKALELAPANGEGWRTLCNIAEQAHDYELAVEAGRKCTELMPDSHFSWFGYGVALCRVERYTDAIGAYQHALKLKPDRADIWDNLGQTFQSLNRLEEAEQAFCKSIDVAGQTIPDEDNRIVEEKEYGNRHWHLALLQLLRGNLRQGFARYRSRFEQVGGLKRPDFSRPLWNGEDIKGKTILITDEQGFGDTLMLARYLPLMKEQGASIIFSIHKVLIPLFEGWESVDTIITHGDRVPPYDAHASVFDLPYFFKTDLSNIPAQVPYLPVPTPRDATALHGDGRPRVGVVWGGSPKHSNDRKRSIPLQVFAGMFGEKTLQFFSLNRDMKEGDVTLLPQYPVTDTTPQIKDFADAARVIQQLDLVITCDTATAHLVGGLGKAVWVLLPFAPDWRWLTERSDNPWYPTARLFRQPSIGDWHSVIGEVRSALKDKFKS